MKRGDSDSSFTSDGVTLRGHRYLSLNSVLAYLYAFAENYDSDGCTEAADALRSAAENLRTGTRT